MIRLRPLLAAAVVLAASAGIAACGSGGGGDTVDNSSCPASGANAYYPEPGTNDDANVVGERIPQMPHDHVDAGKTVNYEHNPPTSGCHYSTDSKNNVIAPIKPGVYTEHIDAEYWVHNLEHGYIAVLYDCGSQGAKGCPDDFAKIRTWASNLPPDPGLLQYQQSLPANQQAAFQPYTKILVLPWSGFGHKFAAVSWDYYLPLDSADTTMLQKFYDNHVGHSPEGLTSQ